MATKKESQKTFLQCLALFVLVTIICIALWVLFVKYANHQSQVVNERKYNPSSKKAIVDSVMKAHTDDNRKALDRHIIILYDISRGGVFNRYATPRLNELLLSPLFDSLDQLNRKVDTAATMRNNLSDFPLVSDNRRVGISLVYTGIPRRTKERLNNQVGLLFDDYVNQLIEGYFSFRQPVYGTNIDSRSNTPRRSKSLRGVISDALPSQKRDFETKIMSLPTFALPFSPYAAQRDYFAKETLIIRVSDRYSGDVNIQNENLKDLEHIVHKHRARLNDGLSEISFYTQPDLLITHNRSGSNSVYIELYSLKLPRKFRQPISVSLKSQYRGYELRSAINPVLKDDGFHPLWNEWRPTVESGGDLYDLSGKLSAKENLIPFSELPNSYWNYEFRGFGFVAGRFDASSTFGLSFPVVVEREWTAQIRGKTPPGFPFAALAGVLLFSLFAGVADVLLFKRMKAELGHPKMEIADEPLDPQEYPCSNTLYRDMDDGTVQGYTMIVYGRKDPRNPDGEASHNVDFFIRNIGGGVLKVDLELEENGFYDGWQLELTEKPLKIASEKQVVIQVTHLPESAINVKKRLTVTPQNTGQPPIDIVLNLRCTDRIIDNRIGIDFGTVGSCAAVYKTNWSWDELKTSGVVPILSSEPGSMQATEAKDHEEDNDKILQTVINTKAYEEKDDPNFEDLLLAGEAWGDPNTDYPHIYPNFKRFLNEGTTYWKHEREDSEERKGVKPEDAVARLLIRLLKEAKRAIDGVDGKDCTEEYWAEKPVFSRVVLSVPNTVNGRALEIRKQACRLCGVERVDFIREAEAAALYYFRDADVLADGDEKKILFVDFGGGTLDWAVVVGSSVEVDGRYRLKLNVLSQGSEHLGGIDLDREVAQCMLNQAAEKYSQFQHHQALLEQLMLPFDSLSDEQKRQHMKGRFRLKNRAEKIKHSLGNVQAEYLIGQFILEVGQIDHTLVTSTIEFEAESILEKLKEEDEDRTLQQAAALMRRCIKEEGPQEVVVSGRSIRLSAVRDVLEEVVRDSGKVNQLKRIDSEGREKEAIAIAAARYCVALKPTGLGGRAIMPITRQYPPESIGTVHTDALEPEDQFKPIIKWDKPLDESGRIRGHTSLEAYTNMEIHIGTKSRYAKDGEHSTLHTEQISLKSDIKALKLVLELDDRQDRIKAELYSGKKYPVIGDTKSESLDEKKIFDAFDELEREFEVGWQPNLNLPPEKRWPR